MENRFVADVQLGKLARWLRLLGIDTLYQNDYTPDQLLKMAQDENRVLLTRNAAMAKNKSIETLIISSEEPMEQLQQVISQYNLRLQINPFSRCMICNGMLHQVNKDEVLENLEPNTARFYHQFWKCQHCGHIYWKGAHYQRMQQRLAGLAL